MAKASKTAEKKVAGTKEFAWELRLYIAGNTTKSTTALNNLKKYCEEHLKGQYKIEVIDLLVNPSKPMIDKDTSFLFRLISNAGDELIELPVSFSIFKDGKPVFSNPNNFTLVRQGHYDFNYTFSEPGKYILFVDIKDIFYTFNILNSTFEVNVQVPIAERISVLLQSFVVSYYYIYILLAALIGIFFIMKARRHKDVKKMNE